ncbi:cupin domain-containing protein [Actinoplanes sp. NPDC051513]|uniref:cupin domain-containing protein n=1 Tax=Actinoplanes sp. NPDC051513 TaxID=3363908 RepID=UPI0037B78109
MTGTQNSPASRIVTPVLTTPQTQRLIPFLGERYRVRVSGQDTAGTFAVLEIEATRGHGSPLHVHRDACETFLVLEGTLRVVVDGQEHEAGPGSAAVLPGPSPGRTWPARHAGPPAAIRPRRIINQPHFTPERAHPPGIPCLGRSMRC